MQSDDSPFERLLNNRISEVECLESQIVSLDKKIKILEDIHTTENEHKDNVIKALLEKVASYHNDVTQLLKYRNLYFNKSFELDKTKEKLLLLRCNDIQVQSNSGTRLLLDLTYRSNTNCGRRFSSETSRIERYAKQKFDD